MYAEVMVMYFSAADSQVIVDTLTNELVLVNNWLIADNYLFMHESKTEYMLFGTGPKLALSTSFSIVIDGKALNRVSEYNILGFFSMRRLHGMHTLTT